MKAGSVSPAIPPFLGCSTGHDMLLATMDALLSLLRRIHDHDIPSSYRFSEFCVCLSIDRSPAQHLLKLYVSHNGSESTVRT